ncbi:MAG: topology modulation protein [Clostridiales bacterium]|nr:topology modulation protein [Clostridiales bacterium]
MAKIIIIGCPGSGKSTMTFKINEILNYPVLHLDKTYHIDNNTHISRAELVEKVNSFVTSHQNWIIDGNYISTIEQRIQLADTVILLDIDKDTCIQNAIGRSKKEKTADMADGFDNSQIQNEFIEFIKNFKSNSLPKIMELLEHYKHDKKIFIFKTYSEIDDFIKALSTTTI